MNTLLSLGWLLVMGSYTDWQVDTIFKTPEGMLMFGVLSLHIAITIKDGQSS